MMGAVMVGQKSASKTLRLSAASAVISLRSLHGEPSMCNFSEARRQRGAVYRKGESVRLCAAGVLC